MEGIFFRRSTVNLTNVGQEGAQSTITGWLYVAQRDSLQARSTVRRIISFLRRWSWVTLSKLQTNFSRSHAKVQDLRWSVKRKIYKESIRRFISCKSVLYCILCWYWCWSLSAKVYTQVIGQEGIETRSPNNEHLCRSHPKTQEAYNVSSRQWIAFCHV